MSGWQKALAPLVRNVEGYYDALKYRIYEALGHPEPIKIQAYRGHGTEERGIGPAMADDPLWKNLVNTYKRTPLRLIC